MSHGPGAAGVSSRRGAAEDPVAYLRASDPVLRGLIDQIGPAALGDTRGGRPADHYGALVRSIIGQQLSTKAARAIYNRLTDRFGGRTPTPQEVLADDPAELVGVKGIGTWSAHMFLMFHLQRPDILPVGDLGIRKAVRVAYGLGELPLAPAIEAIAEPWRPYRTLASRFLWHSLDITPD